MSKDNRQSAKRPTVDIRQATAADLDDVIACAHAAYSRYVDRIGKQPAPMIADFASQIDSGVVYIACCNQQFAGYVVFYADASEGVHLENVAVLPEMSGQGIGKQLIEFVEQSARQQNVRSVVLYTNEAMTENLKLYPRLGYVEVERKQQDGFNRVFFRKEL